MFHLHLIYIGKLKESYWRDAEAEYLKRLRPYAKITVTEITEEPFRDEAGREKTQEKEAAKIEKHLSPDDTIIACDEHGKNFSSTAFAKFLGDSSTRGERLVMIIGGPLGLHPSILSRARHRISLSPLTFTHQMARIILLEQLYRSATILSGKPYHY